jgi:hypothetical protein
MSAAAITLEHRITYWRSRAKLAKRFGLTEEATGAARIAEVLTEAKKAQRKADEEVDRIHAAMPEELYAQD